jgi:hypothetical protein
MCGGGVDGLADLSDDLFADIEGGGGVGDEDRDGELLSVGQGDEAEVIRRVRGGAVLAGGAGFVGYGRAGREQGFEAVIAGVGGVQAVEQEVGVLGRERRAIGQATEQRDVGARGGGVAVLQTLVAILVLLGVDDVDAIDAKGAEPGGGYSASADGAEECVGCDVVALGDGALDEFADGDVDGAVGVLVAEGAVIVGSGQVGWDDVDGLVEGETALLDLVQRDYGDGELVGGLHSVSIGGGEIAVERDAGKGAGDSDASVGLGGDLFELRTKLRLRGNCGSEGREGDGEGETYGGHCGIVAEGALRTTVDSSVGNPCPQHQGAFGKLRPGYGAPALVFCRIFALILPGSEMRRQMNYKGRGVDFMKGWCA